MAPGLNPDKQEGTSEEDLKAVTATSTSEEDEECVYSILDSDDVIPRRDGICCTRIFDIFNVKLHPNGTKCGLDGEMCAICGFVQVVDDEIDTRYNVYYRKVSEPEIVKCGGDLSLAGFPVVQCSKQLQVSADLYCLSHNAVIADGFFNVDYTSAYEFDKVIPNNVYGEDGWVSVGHITYQHAHIALVEEIVVEGNHVGDIDLFGSVVMHFDGNHANDCDKYPQITLFDNLLSNSAPVKYNQYIQLSRSYLVVPGFCSHRIELRFQDDSGQHKIVKDMVLKDDSTSSFEDRIDENSVLKLSMDWPPFYGNCVRERKLIQKLSAKQIFLSNIDSVEFKSKVQAGGPSRFAHMSFDKCSFVEVFSVVPCIQDDNLEIYGTIRLIGSSDDVCYIFEGPEKYFKSKPLTVTCYPSNCDCSDDGFRIEVDLKGNDGTIGNGVMYWDDSHIESLSDRHLCSIFEGDMGYVAIHYSMINRSLIARITTSLVQIVKGPQVFFDVFGNIKAGYAGYEYATMYDQDFYRSTLFSRNSDECVKVELGSVLPLSKSVMAVPENDSLILDLKLKIKLVEDEEFETVEQEVSFQPYACGLYAIGLGNYALSICVQWSDGEDANSRHSVIPDKRSLRKAMQSLNV